MNEKLDNNKWKEYLLKSSLPLEQLVSEVLEKKDFTIAGEYAYIRPNEQGIDTEFSIDLHCYKDSEAEDFDKSNRLDLLIECKYTSPGIKWIFSPGYRGFRRILEVGFWGYKHIYCLRNSFNCASHNLQTNFDFYGCTRGIAIHDNNRDTNTILHGLNQLRYGMPNLIFKELLIFFDKDNPAYHVCICPILVTTAELYVLKFDQNLDNYHQANTLEDVTEKVHALVVAQEPGPLLRQYCQNLIVERTFGTKHAPMGFELEPFYKRYFPSTFSIVVTDLVALNYLLEVLEKRTIANHSLIKPTKSE